MIGWWPSFQPRIHVAFEGDGSPLHHHAAELDAIAEEHGLPLLSAFTDQREPPPDFDGFPEDLAEALGPWREWFSPTDGLRCVSGLMACLARDGVRARLRFPDRVLDELAALERVLATAKDRGARFRLEYA